MQTIIDYHNNYIHSLNEENKDELEYFSNVNDIIEEYNKLDHNQEITKNNPINMLLLQDDMQDMVITNKTDLNDIYWIDNENNKISKDKIIKNYNNIVNDKPLINYYNFNKCKYCNNEMCTNGNDGIIVCNKCGNVERLLIESEIPSYKDNGTDKPIYPYKRLNHFMECINQFQAKENIIIPDNIYQQIKEVFKKRRINDLSDLSLNEVRDVLKMLKLNKYYEHVSFIHSKITGKTPPRLTYTEENKLKLLFKRIDKSFIKFCPKDRSNFFNYNYLLHKLFKILHMEQYLDYFPLLKSEEKLTKQEKIWKLVCKDIGLEYIPE